MRKSIQGKILKAIILACSASILSLSSVVAEAHGKCNNEVCIIPIELVPYFAFDGQMRHMRWSRDFGGNLFKKNYPEADFSLGLRVGCYFGIEAGYRVGVTKNREVTLGAGTTVLGQPIVNPPVLYTTKAQLKGWHGAFLGYWPIWEDCLELFGALGATNVHLAQRVRPLIDNTAIAITPGTEDSTFKKNKTVLSLAAGIQMYIDEKTLLRLRLGWENTRQLKTIRAKENANVLKPKNSFSYGLGFVFNFL